jgi:translation initiation factor 2 alpha subunit (eIF-2alpha)
MSLTNCRFYEEKFPEIDSFVMVNVKQVIFDSGLGNIEIEQSS